jgi:hypothetical protein
MSRLFFLAVVVFHASVVARVAFPIPAHWEDSVRIVLLTDTPAGICPDFPNVGRQTRDFVIASLDTHYVHHVKILNRNSVTVDSIAMLWPGVKPHAIVDINAGFTTTNSHFSTVLAWAYQQCIGVVSIGSSPYQFAAAIWNATDIASDHAPMYDARWLDKQGDSLWVRIRPSADTLYADLPDYFMRGITHNAVMNIQNGDSVFLFKPVGPDGRCAANVWELTIPSSQQIMPAVIGNQQGYNNFCDLDDPFCATTIGASGQYAAIAGTQKFVYLDGGALLQNCVALAFQPQFLNNSIAAMQIVYDAIMFSSVNHLFHYPDPVWIGIRISPRIDTVVVPGTAVLSAEILPVELPDSSKQLLLQRIRWCFDPETLSPGDSLLDSIGPQTRILRTACCKTLSVIASLYDTVHYCMVYDTGEILSIPNSAAQIGDYSNSALYPYFRVNTAIRNGSIWVTFTTEIPLRSAKIGLTDIAGKSIATQWLPEPAIGVPSTFFALGSKAQRILLLRFSGETMAGTHFELIDKRVVLQ